MIQKQIAEDKMVYEGISPSTGTDLYRVSIAVNTHFRFDDFGSKNWDEAVNFAENLADIHGFKASSHKTFGNLTNAVTNGIQDGGIRLPTLKEFKLLTENLKNKNTHEDVMNAANRFYWTLEEYGISHACIYQYPLGGRSHAPKEKKYSALYVFTLPAVK